MANDVNVQVLENGFRNYVVRAYGILDTSDIALADLIDTTAAAFQTGNRDKSGNPYTVKLEKAEFDIEDGLAINLFWDATADKLIASLVGRGCLEFNPPVPNNAGAGKTGKVLYSSTGWAGVLSYNVTLSFVKAYS